MRRFRGEKGREREKERMDMDVDVDSDIGFSGRGGTDSGRRASRRSGDIGTDVDPTRKIDRDEKERGEVERKSGEG